MIAMSGLKSKILRGNILTFAVTAVLAAGAVERLSLEKTLMECAVVHLG